MKWRLRPAQLLGSFGVHAEEESNLLATGHPLHHCELKNACANLYNYITYDSPYHKNHCQQVVFESRVLFSFVSSQTIAIYDIFLCNRRKS